MASVVAGVQVSARAGVVGKATKRIPKGAGRYHHNDAAPQRQQQVIFDNVTITQTNAQEMASNKSRFGLIFSEGTVMLGLIPVASWQGL